MAGTRSTFGRVDAIAALLQLLRLQLPAEVQINDAPAGDMRDECIFIGFISGSIVQGPYTSTKPTIDDDEFAIPVHINAANTAAQPASLDARRRCEQLMTAVRQTVASAKTLDGVPGLMYVTNGTADGPDPELLADPVGWVAFGTVTVNVRIRMR